MSKARPLPFYPANRNQLLATRRSAITIKHFGPAKQWTANQ
jgi:hypothetical protein